MRVQRHREVARRLFVPVEDVVMLPRNPMMAKVSLADMSAPMLLSSPMESDESGPRQHSLLFRPGTRAMAMMPSGAGIAMSELSVHVTEFTVGKRGPAAMPGDLPANSAYTYAAELAVDEAEAMGAGEVRFDPPLVNYVDNFLHFPAGTAVPVGYYDENKDAWEAADSGIVIDIVDIQGGKAAVDIDGDGRADSAAVLEQHGIDAMELGLLAQRYDKGKSLWRTSTPNFSKVDFNWGRTLPSDGVTAPAKGEAGGAEDAQDVGRRHARRSVAILD